MKKYIVGFTISVFVYLFVLSLGHSYYMMQVNKSLERTILELVEQVSEYEKEHNRNIE